MSSELLEEVRQELRSAVTRLNEVELRVEDLPVRSGSGGGGGGSSNVATVSALPAIPLKGLLEVYWTSAGGGSGDDQVWRAFKGQTKFTATQFRTTKSGLP